MPPASHNPVFGALPKLLARRGGGEVVVLADDADAAVWRLGDTVYKVHAPETVESELGVRLRLAGAEPVRRVLLAPLAQAPERLAGRLVSRWPYAEPLSPDELERVPWERAGAMLAELHRIDVRDLGVGQTVPLGGGPRRVLTAIDKLHGAPDCPEKAAVLEAFATLPPAAKEQRPTSHLVHGDWHLGQLVHAAALGWRLVDVDELGVGDPVWDLARPAAWYACGLMPAEAWQRFLTSYLAAGGPAVPPADPWLSLDVPARALVVQSAARVVEKAARAHEPYDPGERALIEACTRIARSQHGEPTR